MIYQLPNGKVIYIPEEMYLDMTDEQWIQELEELNGNNYGELIEDPFYHSVIKKETTDDLFDYDKDCTDFFEED